MAHYVGYDHLTDSMKVFVASLASVEIPRDIQEAMKKSEWRQAILEEMSGLEILGMW